MTGYHPLAQVLVRFSPATALPKSCVLVLASRRDAMAAGPAATLVFKLHGEADVSQPLRQVAVAAPLYSLAVQEATVTNPFARGEYSLTGGAETGQQPCCGVDKARRNSSMRTGKAEHAPRCWRARHHAVLADCDFSVSIVSAALHAPAARAAGKKGASAGGGSSSKGATSPTAAAASQAGGGAAVQQVSCEGVWR